MNSGHCTFRDTQWFVASEHGVERSKTVDEFGFKLTDKIVGQGSPSVRYAQCAEHITLNGVQLGTAGGRVD